jgi:hypothetical protein
VFHPVRTTRDKVNSAFCGDLTNRPFIKRLLKESGRRGWTYDVRAPELGTEIVPTELNDLYNGALICPNEQHLMTFGRELNQRTFDVGMAGRIQISDMGHLASRVIGPYARFYACKLADGADREFAIRLMEHGYIPDADEVHGYFRMHQSFSARLASISAAIGRDLSRGRIPLARAKAIPECAPFFCNTVHR